MRYAGIIRNDFTAAPGVCLTFFTQGCPHKCPGCHNSETWSFFGGKDFTLEVLINMLADLKANGITRNFCLMGGEPLCEQNLELSHLLVTSVKKSSPKSKIYIWTGYTLEQLLATQNETLLDILKNSDVLVDGLYIEALRDIRLPMRGSSNQRIIDLHKVDLSKKI